MKNNFSWGSFLDLQVPSLIADALEYLFELKTYNLIDKVMSTWSETYLTQNFSEIPLKTGTTNLATTPDINGCDI